MNKRQQTFKLTDEQFLLFIKGHKLNFDNGYFITSILPPHYEPENDDYKRGFDDGVFSQKTLNRFADIAFNPPPKND